VAAILYFTRNLAETVAWPSDLRPNRCPLAPRDGEAHWQQPARTNRIGFEAERIMWRRFVGPFVISASLAAAGAAATSAAQGTPVLCASLSSAKLPDASVKLAQEVTESTFTPPGAAAPLSDLPPFCRVVGEAKPAVGFEVWMPLANWNGKFQGVGNGGSAGVISYGAMANALRRGYATASTDTGHVNKRPFDATWAVGRPDLVEDFGYRGIHVMTEHGKNITGMFYGSGPRHAYFVGCSTGGRQALTEAQRYPGDYDGIVAGDPANNWTRFYAGAHLWTAIALMKDPESYIPAGKMPLLGNAVNAACDALDGVTDGVLDDPRACKYDPAALTCKPGQDPETCFTAKQVKAIKDIWAGVRDSSGELVYPPFVPGGESGPGGWAGWITGSAPFASTHWQAADNTYKYMIFNNPEWDYQTFDFDKDLRFSLEKLGKHLDAVDPNLQPLKARGAKLIMYHGWSDPAISPLNSINYYESVVAVLGRGRSRDVALRETQDFFRLFMVPGMQHCSNGPGATTFDMLAALENWVEKKVAPDHVIASRLVNGVAERTRPLCAYPKVAVYKGSGSTNDAANFECRDSR
jgi:feruloyl esterase